MLVVTLLVSFFLYVSSEQKCPIVDGPDSVYFPDEKNCSRFYQCSNGVAYLQNCSAGLNWDPKIQVCVWPSQYSCTERDSTTVKPPSPTEKPTPSYKCPAIDGPDSVYFPDERNCSRFYQCSNGVAYLQNCSTGLNWDPKIQVCVWPSQYSCTERDSTTIKPPSPTEKPAPSNRCPAVDGSDSVYFPDERNCSRFYQCSNGVAYLQNCSAGLNWDPKIQVCVWPSQYSCTERDSTTVKPPSPTEKPARSNKCPAVDGTDSVYFPDERNCSRFYQCSNGVAYLQNCSAGLNWNPKIQVCVWPSQYSCTERDSTTVKPPSPTERPAPSNKCPAVDGSDSVYFPDERNCSRFYQCSNGVAYLQNCSAGLNWDPKIQVCVWPSQYACTERDSTTLKPPSPTEKPAPSNKCPAVDGPDSVYFPDERNCSRFYQCSNGVAYLLNCPAGLNWEPKVQVCVWPSQYNCSIQYLSS